MKTPKYIYIVVLITTILSIEIKAQINGKLIGEQIWMTTNLNVAKFQNGDPIFEAKTKAQWVKASEDKKPAWCYYKNNVQNGAIYGKLYNWYAVNDPRGLAPKGWHIPSKSEWDELSSFLEKNIKDVNEALKAKTNWKKYEVGGNEVGSDCSYCNGTGRHSSGRACWICGGSGGDRRFVKKRILSGNGTNTSGFSAKPGADRFDDGDFSDGLGDFGIWWFDNETNSDNAYANGIYIDNDHYTPKSDSYRKGYGFSMRLVKDNPAIIEKQRLAKLEKIEKERLAKEAIIEKERLAKEAIIEKQRQEKEAFINKIKKSSTTIIGQTTLVGNLMIAQKDFPEKMKWWDAKTACTALGDGWRLPTKSEMLLLFQNKATINGIYEREYYWSSTELENDYRSEYIAWLQRFDSGKQVTDVKDNNYYVRAVKDVK